MLHLKVVSEVKTFPDFFSKCLSSCCCCCCWRNESHTECRPCMNVSQSYVPVWHHISILTLSHCVILHLSLEHSRLLSGSPCPSQHVGRDPITMKSTAYWSLCLGPGLSAFRTLYPTPPITRIWIQSCLQSEKSMLPQHICGLNPVADFQGLERPKIHTLTISPCTPKSLKSTWMFRSLPTISVLFLFNFPNSVYQWHHKAKESSC